MVTLRYFDQVGYEVLLDQASLGFFFSGFVEVSFEGHLGVLLSLYIEAERISMTML